MGGGAAACCLAVRDGTLDRAYALVKWVYCLLFTIVTIATWVLRDYSDDWFVGHREIFSYCQAPGLEALCSGKQVAVRISLANCCFFGGHALLLFWCTGRSDIRAGLHTGLWFWKVLAWAGAIVGFFFVPSSSVVVYAQVARFGAGLFLVFVMVEMVSWVYDLNAALLARDSCLSWTALVSGAAVSVLGGLALVGYSYYSFAATPACHLNLFLITWTLVVGFALVGALFVPNRLEAAGLMTSGAVFAYGAWLLYSALGRVPADACVRAAANDRGLQISGFFLGIGAVCYSTASLGTSAIFSGKGGAAGPIVGGGGDEEDAGGGGGGEEGRLPYRPDAFHLVFALASMYMAMLLTNWQVSSSTARFEMGAGWASAWVTLGSKWLCEALYLWTVLAPAVLRGRDFG